MERTELACAAQKERALADSAQERLAAAQKETKAKQTRLQMEVTDLQEALLARQEAWDNLEKRHAQTELDLCAAERATVAPSPATHAILALLEAGESVFQMLSVTKTVFHAPR